MVLAVFPRIIGLFDILVIHVGIFNLFETIRNMFGVFFILLLNVMELLSVVGGALLDRPCMVFQRMCVLCLWSQ